MTILYVDDDPEDTAFFYEALVRLNESNFLAEDSLECLAVTNGRKALDLLNSIEELPELIFLDINMPVVDGKQWLLALKSIHNFSRIPIVMFSSSCKDQELKEFKTLGAVDLIKKPDTLPELVEILSKTIKSHMSRQ